MAHDQTNVALPRWCSMARLRERPQLILDIYAPAWRPLVTSSFRPDRQKSSRRVRGDHGNAERGPNRQMIWLSDQLKAVGY